MTDDRACGATLVDRALAQYDLVGAHAAFLTESFNVLYRVDAAGRHYALRIGPAHRIHRRGVAEAEDALTTAARAAGVRAPRLVRSRAGAAAVEVDGRECVLFTWVDGAPLRPPASVADAADLATIAARLHSMPAVPRPPGALDARASVLLFEIADRLDEAGPQYGALFADARDRAQAAVDALTGARRLLHGDLTLRNVVRGPAGVAAVDFQDLFWGHVEQDLAHSLFSLTREDTGHRLTGAFRTSYERLAPWPFVDPGLLVARRLQMVNLALTLRREGLDEYVARHAQALRDASH
jgi:Ser/Thr protein kinase RdoA (MazF antagonist)